MRTEKLPTNLVWQGDGHLSEVALVALADGQDILPSEAQAHVDGCEACTLRLGEAALLSAGIGMALAGSMKAAEAPAPRALAVVPIVAGLAVAALGAVPLVLDASAWLPHAPALVAHAVPVLAHTGFLALRSVVERSQGVVMASCASLLVLLLSGFGVLRLAPREGVAR
jgi:hypothetical protein